jgi:hypothetical protein
MVDDDPEIETSPLSRSVTEDGITVRVEIYRLVGKDERWSLEVVDHEGSSTVWSNTFATDLEANTEFTERWKRRASALFSNPPPPRELN